MNPFRLVLLVSGNLLLGACATVGPDYQAPIATPLAEFQEMRESAGLRIEAPSELAHWWRSLNDSTLNQLIDQAIEKNLDLRAATARLRQARAERGFAGGARFPSLDVSGAALRNGSSENAAGGSITNLYSGGFDAGWEVDLFGGVRRSVEAADADLQASVESQRDTLISVLAEVSLNYVELRSFQARLRIAEENLASQQNTFDLIQSQQQAGLVEELDLQRARSNVESTRAQLPLLATSIEQARNRLATLLGEQAGAIDALLQNAQVVPNPPLEVAIGVPAEVLRRRPDIRQAERQLAAATARIGVATAELYPKLGLSGSIGLESLHAGSLFEAASRAFGIGSLISWSLFDGGAIQSRIEVQNALQEQALIGWENAVLTAVEEVENALTAYANEQLRHRSLHMSAQAASRAAELARSRYDAGLSTFLEVLDADRSRLAAEDALAVSKAQITSNLITLYKALGGGWETLLPANQVAAPGSVAKSQR